MRTWRRNPMSCLLFWFLMVCQGVELCASINGEGMALLKFREMVESDPHGALLDWGVGAPDPCSWFGVGCSDDGKVMTLHLEGLGLKGMLSPDIGKLIHMKSLILHNNSFYGVIPRAIGDLQELAELDLGYNNFSGLVPLELGNILSLEFLILRGNRFSGGLSPELHALNMFCEFQLDQGLTWSNRASITRNVGNTTFRRLLVALNENNPLKDQTTVCRSGTFVAASSVSEQSRVPELDPLQAFPKKAPPHPSVGIPGTKARPSPPADDRKPPVEIPAPPSSPLVLPPSPPPPLSSFMDKLASHEGNSTRSLKIYVSVAGAVCFVLVLSAVYLLLVRRKKASTVVPVSSGLSAQLQKAFVSGVPSFQRSELETACENFSNIIGSFPGYTLYKGILSNEVEIAVLSTSIASAGAWSSTFEAQFRKKVEVLSKVNHKNFMNLLGYCEEEKPFTRMMVFEYAPNGTLFEHLHIKESEQLDWPTRLRIAMGVIYCLEYMHQQDPPVIIRNLNSSSIYLTEDCAAKISDIGCWSEEKESDGSDQENTVYKFGVLLLEMISGRLPFSEDDGLLVLWALSYLNGQRPLMSMADPMLNSIPEEHVSALCKLIQSCINPDMKARPAVAEVAEKMREITAISPNVAIPRLSPLWWAELEIITL